MDKFLAALLVFLGLVAAGIVFGALLALPVMFLWNWLMPVLFHLPEISWAQAWGLSIFCGFLFKNNTSNNQSSKS